MLAFRIPVVDRGLLRSVHPLVKVACALALFIFSMVIPKVTSIFVYFLLAFALLALSRMAGSTIKILLLLSPFALFVGGVNYWVGGNIDSGIFVGMRIFFFGLSVVMLAFTTTPAEIVRSLETIKFPRMLTLGTLVAMRFVPVFIEEWIKITQSLRLRGGAFKRNPYFYYRALCVPLIYKIFTTADVMTLSLYTKGFTPDGKRTCYREMPFKMFDAFFLGAFLSASVALAVV